MAKLLTVRELAQHVGYSETRVRRLVHEGALPALRVRSGAEVRFDLDEVLAHMRQAGRPEPATAETAAASAE